MLHDNFGLKTGTSGVSAAANHACYMLSSPRCALQAKLAKLRRELLEPSTGAGAGGGGKGEGKHAAVSLLIAVASDCLSRVHRVNEYPQSSGCAVVLQ